jgi:hypothetical protein
MSTQRYRQFDFSGGMQSATSFLMKKQNEIENVRNGRFGVELGSIVRRNGHERVGATFGTTGETTPTGGKIIKFTTGNVRFVAVNNNAGTATLIRTQDSGTGAWTTLSGIPSIPVDAKVFFFLYLDEVYVSGYDPATGDPITPFNVNSSLSVSLTRNIAHMPACRYICEYNGALFAANVKIGSTRYKDRAYKSSGPLGAVTFVQAAQTGVLTYITVDSVRYLKASDVIDIYDAGTETKLYDITITSVDKSLNRIYFTGFSQTFTAATSDIITVASTTLLPTGTPIQVSTTTTLPAGLAASTTYYVINLSGTTFKLATSRANALAGTPVVDITSTGSGTHTMSLVYELSDNDEIWLDGRKGTLNILWNQDYPTPESSDWTATLPGTDSSNEITGIAKSSNRLFLFTKNSAQKYDGANTVTFNNAVGCISHSSIANIDDDWLIWCDAKGRIWARNESSGQQEYISRGIYNRVMKYITDDNLAASSGFTNSNTYYIDLGQNTTDKGSEYLRAVYSFDDNLWSVDRLTGPAMFGDNDDYTGENKPYFFSTDGYLYIDDTGNLDHTSAIPLEINIGRDQFGSEQLKKFDAMFIYSHDAAGMTIKASVGTGQAQTMGQIQEDEQYLKFPERGEDALKRGTTLDIALYGASKGDPPYVQGIVTYFSVEEEVPSERRPK